jgi:hypothetical protein
MGAFALTDKIAFTVFQKSAKLPVEVGTHLGHGGKKYLEIIFGGGSLLAQKVWTDITHNLDQIIEAGGFDRQARDVGFMDEIELMLGVEFDVNHKLHGRPRFKKFVKL